LKGEAATWDENALTFSRPNFGFLRDIRPEMPREKYLSVTTSNVGLLWEKIKDNDYPFLGAKTLRQNLRESASWRILRYALKEWKEIRAFRWNRISARASTW